MGLGHSRQTLGLGTPGVSGLGTPGNLCWALRGVSGVGHARESLGLALQGVSTSRPGKEKSSGRGEELGLKSNSPSPKVGNNKPKFKNGRWTFQITDVDLRTHTIFALHRTTADYVCVV